MTRDGQMTDFDRVSDSDGSPSPNQLPDIWKGILGGYSAYDDVVCTRLFPLARCAFWTSRLRHLGVLEFFPGDGLSLIVIAASFDMRKIFVVDAESLQVMMLLPQEERVIPAVPEQFDVPESTVDADEQPKVDGLMRWLECFASRLATGVYEVNRIIPDDPRSVGLVLFPLCPPMMTCRVTHGVRARATSVYAAESGGHVYTVRLAHEATSTWPTCQLEGRHWDFHLADGSTQEVCSTASPSTGTSDRLFESSPCAGGRERSGGQISGAAARGRVSGRQARPTLQDEHWRAAVDGQRGA